MPTTVTASNGNSYHLWQLPNLSAPEPIDSQEFSMLEVEKSEGYRAKSLFGLNTGIRSWTLNLPSLADSTVIAAAVTDPYAATVSRVDYVRNLYKYNRTTGMPFAYQDPDTLQYYLVDFVNVSLSMKKKKIVDIYDCTVELRQRRLPGVTVFNPWYSLSGTSYSDYGFYEGANFNTPTWNATYGLTNMTATGDVVKVAAGVNGEDYVRFNNTSNNGYVAGGVSASTLAEFFLVMRMREASFSNTAGIVTGTGGTAILTGSSGTTKFTNPALSTTYYQYRLNGTAYAQSDLQAPMASTWGIVHVRYESEFSTASGSVTLGRNDITDNNYAEIDIAECAFYCGTPLSVLKGREVTEYLAVKYGITLA